MRPPEGGKLLLKGSVSWVLTALLGGGADLVVALCFLSSLMATSLKSLYMLAGRKMGPGDLLGVGLPGGGGRGRLPRGNGGDIRRPIKVSSVNLVEFFSWRVNATIGGA